MNADPILLSAAVTVLGVAILGLFGFLKYALGVWAIRTAKSQAERKAQAEVAKKAVSASPARGLVKLPGSRGKGVG